MNGKLCILFTDMRRRPNHTRTFVNWAWLSIIRMLSKPYVHVLVGDLMTDTVISPQADGLCRWSLTSFCEKYPTIVCAFEIESDAGPDFSIIKDQGFTWRDSLLRYITRGWYDPQDCVGVAISQLRMAGYRPPRLASPRQLHDWLLNRRFKHVSFITQD